ncbi:MAG: helix-turn-helix domain-containing protein [Clostridia bacterium]|nr:helix-turn-helix domain-containing protein [Clostridia bacterium]
MAFADNIYFLRKREGISQEELAERLSVSRQAVSKWETGDAYPETDKIIALCDMFGVTMDELLRGDVTKEVLPPVAGEPEDRPESKEAAEKPHSVWQPAAQSLLWLLAAVIYLILGIFGDLWHPMWIIFVFMPAVTCGVEIIFAPKGHRLNKVLSFLESLAVFGSAGTYLLCGFFLGMWGTAWIVFLLIPVTCSACEAFRRKNKR